MDLGGASCDGVVCLWVGGPWETGVGETGGEGARLGDGCVLAWWWGLGGGPVMYVTRKNTPAKLNPVTQTNQLFLLAWCFSQFSRRLHGKLTRGVARYRERWIVLLPSGDLRTDTTKGNITQYECRTCCDNSHNTYLTHWTPAGVFVKLLTL